MLSAGPNAEFVDHEYPISSVAIDAKGEFGAAGAEDGLLIIWNLSTQSTAVTYQCSISKK